MPKTNVKIGDIIYDNRYKKESVVVYVDDFGVVVTLSFKEAPTDLSAGCFRARTPMYKENLIQTGRFSKENDYVKKMHKGYFYVWRYLTVADNGRFTKRKNQVIKSKVDLEKI